MTHRCLLAVVALALLTPALSQAQNKADKKPPSLVGWIELTGPLREGPVPFAWVTEADLGPSVRGIVAKCRRVADNPRYKGVVFYLDRPTFTMSQVYEIGQALRAVRAAGKKSIVFSEQYDLGSYLFACGADQIALRTKGLVSLNGLGGEEMYMAGLLEKIGMKADFLQVGKYKGADEALTRTGPSKAWSENFDNLLDDMYGQVIGRIAEARKLTPKQVEAAFADSWTMTDADYVKRGLVDVLSDSDLADLTKKAFGDDFEWDEQIGEPKSQRNTDNPLAVFQMLFQPPRPKARRPSIAMVHFSGVIMSGKNSAGLFGGQTVGSRTIEQALMDAADDKLIKGVVLRIDSPGGSALASEVMWQAVRKLAAKKPVFVSIGPMAASGGYYIAAAGQRIYAPPNAIIGSIGVVGGKITMGGLYEKLGIGIHRRSRGPLADMFNSVEPFTEEQRVKLRSAFKRTYDQFVDRVRKGRGKQIKDMDAVTQGRLFTGRQAARNGLIDKVGGVEATLGDMARHVGFKPGQYDVMSLPAPQTFPEFLEEMFGSAQAPSASRLGADQAAVLQAARAVLGESAWRSAVNVLDGLMLLKREPVLTLMPKVVRWR